MQKCHWAQASGYYPETQMYRKTKTKLKENFRYFNTILTRTVQDSETKHYSMIAQYWQQVIFESKERMGGKVGECG